MEFERRQYQDEASDAGASFLLDSSQKNGLIVLPTGAGKSRVIAMIAQRLNAPLLVFNPSKEILEQNLEKFHSYGYFPAVYSASGPGGSARAEREESFPVRRDERGRRICRACETPLKPRKFYCSETCRRFVENQVNPRAQVANITLATIGSVVGTKGAKVQRASKAHLFAGFPYIIVDECHEVSAKGGGYKSFFGDVPGPLLRSRKLLPLDLWNSDEMRKRRENAVAKALKEKPSVRLAAIGEREKFYSVKDGVYLVRTYCDPDGQYFIECNCLAGSPPIDEATGLPSREAVPCYHAGAVLIHIAEEEKKR